MPEILMLDDAKLVLEPFCGPIFIEPWLAALDQWRLFVTDTPDLAKPMDATTRANMIHCWTRDLARLNIEGLDGIRETNAMGFFAVVIGSNPIVRFKYIRSGHPSNVSTGQQRLLKRQEYKQETQLRLQFEGVADLPTTLTCGYTLDVAASRIIDIHIRCDYKGLNLWCWPIWGESAVGEGGGGVEPMPIPTAPMPMPRPAAVRSSREAQ